MFPLASVVYFAVPLAPFPVLHDQLPTSHMSDGASDGVAAPESATAKEGAEHSMSSATNAPIFTIPPSAVVLSRSTGSIIEGRSRRLPLAALTYAVKQSREE